MGVTRARILLIVPCVLLHAKGCDEESIKPKKAPVSAKTGRKDDGKPVILCHESHVALQLTFDEVRWLRFCQ